jgi:hypothetical protein
MNNAAINILEDFESGLLEVVHLEVELLVCKLWQCLALQENAALLLQSGYDKFLTPIRCKRYG